MDEVAGPPRQHPRAIAVLLKSPDPRLRKIGEALLRETRPPVERRTRGIGTVLVEGEEKKSAVYKSVPQPALDIGGEAGPKTYRHSKGAQAYIVKEAARRGVKVGKLVDMAIAEYAERHERG